MMVFANMIFLTIYSADKLLQRLHFNLNAGLGERVVVLIEKKQRWYLENRTIFPSLFNAPTRDRHLDFNASLNMSIF